MAEPCVAFNKVPVIVRAAMGLRIRHTLHQAAIDRINAIANPTMPKVGDRFLGTVVKTAAFGAFVSLLPGRDGLLHISKVGDGKRVDKIEDYLNVGDKVEVEIAEIDPRGKIYLDKVRPEGAEAPKAIRRINTRFGMGRQTRVVQRLGAPRACRKETGAAAGIGPPGRFLLFLPCLHGGRTYSVVIRRSALLFGEGPATLPLRRTVLKSR